MSFNADFGHSSNDEPLPIDRAGELWRAAATPGSNITRRSAMRKVISTSNSAVIEATLLLGRHDRHYGEFTGPKLALIRGAYRGFNDKKRQNSWMSDMLIRDLRDAILIHYLDRVDQLLREMRAEETTAFAPVDQPNDVLEPDTDANPTYGMF